MVYKECDSYAKGLLPAVHVPQLTCCVSMLFPLQDAPPFASCVCMTRVLVWVPVPQVILQVDQDAHEAQLQLTEMYQQFKYIRSMKATIH